MKPDLEQDLFSCENIINKCRHSNVYSQNLYAAFCNNRFFYFGADNSETFSWRHSGGIIAYILEKGDYIDWYCSGIGDDIINGYVPEGEVTEEIRLDLIKLGWIIKPCE